MSERDEIIAEMREYFEQRADAEYFTDSAGPVPNEEMQMLAKLDELQAAREPAGLSHGELDAPMTEQFKSAWKNGLPLESMEAKWAFVGWQAAREQEGGEAVVVKDAYDGAREDLQIWKKRALESEKLLQEEIESNARLVEVCNDLTGPTHMGEPVLPPRQGAQEAKPIAYTNGSQLFYLWDEEGEGKMFAEREGDYDIALYTHPSQSQGVPEEYRQALQDACDIIQADANTEENYGSLCRIGSVLSQLSTTTAPQADEWVKCSDQLPKLGQRVKLFSSGVIQHYMPTLDEGDEGVFWDFEQDHNPLVDFRHDQWMPCPQPPEQGDDV